MIRSPDLQQGAANFSKSTTLLHHKAANFSIELPISPLAASCQSRQILLHLFCYHKIPYID